MSNTTLYMKLKKTIVALTLFVSTFSLTASESHANRAQLGVGIVSMSNPTQTNFTISGEFEHRLDAFLGLGATGSYLFSDPGIGLIAVPEAFFHPLGGDWLISAAPLIAFGSSGIGTHVGVKVGTRLPIPLVAFTVIPEISIGFVNNWNLITFGLGIAI
jgi:hypothetical protein